MTVTGPIATPRPLESSPPLAPLRAHLRDEPGLVGALGRTSTVLVVPEAARAVSIAGLVELSRRSPVVVAVPTVADAELPARMGANGEGTVITSTFFSGMPDERTQKFVKAFETKLKEKGETVFEPNQFDAATYDIVMMYATAMKNAKVTGDPAKLAAERAAIRDEVRKLKDFPALVGPLSINSEGDAIKTIYVLEAKNGRWELVDTHKN